ncbi:hypothetical protein BJ138DRAFT_1162170 [Hygrophoropsis aurantiaca]|uniref:Uncharacterized protein n=1 Tax=Hygrophoropsis aurantiaca TaxID=72124 RepID=A0ACB7ZZT0_9AGAM|nr:hypothetical protein BJ138DRAFT_1162170 [Hygrophoropsis aurantiaca]
MPFVGVIMTCYAATANRFGQNVGRFNKAVHYICIICSEGLLILRTYAIWQRNRILLIFLLIFAGLITATAVIMPHIDLKFTQQDFINPGGCIFETNRGEIFQYVLLAFYEIVLLFLTKLQHYRQYSSLVIDTLVWDNNTYMGSVISISVLNIIIGCLAPIQYIEIFNAAQLVIHSVVASRILFNLRECDKPENQMSFANALAEFQDST